MRHSALAAARRLGEPAAVVVSATGPSAQLKEELACHGATRIYAVESADADDHLVTPTVGALELAAREASPVAVLVPATVEGNEMAARFAVRLDAGLLLDAVDLDLSGTVTQIVFGTPPQRTRIRDAASADGCPWGRGSGRRRKGPPSTWRLSCPPVPARAGLVTPRGGRSPGRRWRSGSGGSAGRGAGPGRTSGSRTVCPPRRPSW
jgi:hypothetical protein